MFVSPLILTVALLQATARPPVNPTAAATRAVIRQAQLAVEGDSVARVRARWLRAAARPPSDPLAALGLATLARLTYAYGEAATRYAALERQPVTGVYALLGRGLAQTTRWRADSATLFLGRALSAARVRRDSVAEAEALWVLSRIHARTAGPDSALRTLARAEAIIPVQEKALLADVRCFMARFSAGRNAARADSAVAAAVNLARESGDLRALGRCLHIHATVREIRGLQTRARESAREAVEVFTRARDVDGGAAALQFLAYHTVSYSSEFAAARHFADSAIARGMRAGNPVTVAWAQLNLAQLAQRFGDARAAARLTAASAAAFERMGDRSGLASAAVLQADAAFLTGRLGEARVAYGRADSLQQALGFTGARAPILLKTAGVLRELGRYEDAQRALEEAVRIATAMRFEGITKTDQHYERGMLALSRGDNGQAIREFEEFRTGLGTGTHYEYDAQARIAEALTGLGRLAAAESLLVQVEQVAEELRVMRSEREARVAVLDSRRFDYDTDLGFATMIQRFAAAGRTEAALRIAEDRRARYLWTAMLRRHALREDGKGYNAARTARMLPGAGLDLRQLLSALPDSTALLEFVTGRGGEPTTLFVVTGRGISAHRLPAADSLIEDIATFVAALEGGSPARAAARRLGATLLTPALAALSRAVTRLVIVPDGPFYRVPFDALELADGQPALLRYTISLAPSARIALASWQSPARPRSGTLLALGDPTFDRASGLPRLPGSGREARAIASGSADARVLLGSNASEAALTRMDLRTVRVLHLATHAEVEDFGLLRSALTLAPGNGEDGRVGVADIAGLDLDADLVVLSGCRTAGGVVVTGEGIQGLVAPFLEAGARAVVATQWAMGDRTIVPLISRFYGELRAGQSVSDALRAAKLAARAAGEPPSVWAALMLTGDAQVRPFARTTAGR